jgi:hypothetical protein
MIKRSKKKVEEKLRKIIKKWEEGELKNDKKMNIIK